MVGGLSDNPPLWPCLFYFFFFKNFCLFICVFLRQGLSMWPYREAWKSLCGLGWPENLHVVQADPGLSILLPQPSGWLDCRWTPLYPVMDTLLKNHSYLLHGQEINIGSQISPFYHVGLGD